MIYAHVDEPAVASVVSDWTGIPVGRMVKDEVQTVLQLAEIMGKRVVGQSHGLQMISKRIETNRAKLDNPNKPIGVFMLCGPSGVGKTETALALAESLYGGEQNMITINMSEFQEAHTVSALKGAPPGYVGYGEGGRLTEAVRRKPYSVVLLDEVEKAHPDVHELFFQVFDKGQMEDGTGRRIDFKNTLIILTSNVGTEVIMKMAEEGKTRPDPETLNQALRPSLLQVFPPALLGRLVTIPYFPLSAEMLGGIVRLQLDRIKKTDRGEPRRRIHLYGRRGRAHRFAVQGPGFGRAHDRQHHHQHASARTFTALPEPRDGEARNNQRECGREGRCLRLHRKLRNPAPGWSFMAGAWKLRSRQTGALAASDGQCPKASIIRSGEKATMMASPPPRGYNSCRVKCPAASSGYNLTG